MTDDQQYQNGLQEHSPEQAHANDDTAKSCVEDFVLLIFVVSIAFFVRLFV